jgi:hypothetical protein
MFSKAIEQFWQAVLSIQRKSGFSQNKAAEPSYLRPVTLGVCTEVGIPVGTRKKVRGSELLWICSVEEGRPSKALKTLILPN